MGKGMSSGMGMLSMFKTEGQQVAVMTGAICAAGTAFYIVFNLSGELPLPPSCHAVAPAAADCLPRRPDTRLLPLPLLRVRQPFPSAPQSRTGCPARSRRSGSRRSRSTAPRRTRTRSVHCAEDGSFRSRPLSPLCQLRCSHAALPLV